MKNASDKDKALALRLTIKTYDNKISKETVIPDYVGPIERHENGTAQWITGTMDHPVHGKVAFVGFRGSDQGTANPLEKQDKEKSDWAFNYDFKLIRAVVEDGQTLIVPYGNENSNIKMHRGDREHYGLSREEVRKFVIWAIESGIKKIWFFGHSLGGAICTCAWIDVFHMLNDEIKIAVNQGGVSIDFTGFAFASPAVGNQEFADSFNRRANGHFTNEWYSADPVHTVPTFWQGYRHVKVEKGHADWVSVISSPIFCCTQWATCGALPTWAYFDHFPQRLLAVYEHKPVPRWWELKWE